VEIEQMLRDDVIEHSNSPWSSPLVLIKKKDDSYRFCVDYRKVNAVTVKDSYPLPYISQILDRLRDTTYLSSLDIRSAYWQIPVSEDSRPITAFTVPCRGLFQFKRMPFGLHNSPATFQRLIDRVLQGDLEPYCFAYLDDIIIATPTFDKHVEVLREVLVRLTTAGLTLRQEKCYFCLPSLKYLGYVVDRDGLRVDPDKVAAILNLPEPQNVTEVRRVLGVASWYRRFIPNFSSLTAPISALTQKNSVFKWSDECRKAFTTIKEHLVSAPILSCPNFDQPFFIQTDSSDYGLGAVLSQNLEDGERVISYISRSLQKNERKFSATEKECLAVIWAIEKLRPYIEGSKFTVVTDCHSLIWLNNLKDPSGRLSRWALRLQGYDFDIIHRRGKDNVVPDALSRGVEKVEAINLLPPSNLFDPLDIDDLWYKNLSQRVLARPRKYPCWQINDLGFLYKFVKPKIPDLGPEIDDWKLVLPKSSRHSILQENHDLPTAGHAGIYKTIRRIASRYYWPKLKADVIRYVNHCRVCLAHKVEQVKPAGFMAPRAKATRPWQVLCTDIVGPLPRSRKGNCYILVVADCFTKFALFFPMRNATAPTVTKTIEDNIFLVYGTPQYLISDNGVQFRSNQFTALCNEYRTKILFTARYHPQANPAERINRVLKTMLSTYVKENHRTWEDNLAKVGCAIRTATHEVIGHSPYFANFGREHVLFGNQLGVPPTDNEVLEDPDRSANRPEPKVFETLRKDILSRLARAYEKNAKQYNLRRRPLDFKQGDLVWKRNYVLSDATRNFTAKLAPKYVGPFTIKRKLSPWTYELMNDNNTSLGTWHIKDLKPHSNTPEPDCPTMSISLEQQRSRVIRYSPNFLYSILRHSSLIST
jgi:transposase InsO family protein